MIFLQNNQQIFKILKYQLRMLLNIDSFELLFTSWLLYILL